MKNNFMVKKLKIASSARYLSWTFFVINAPSKGDDENGSDCSGLPPQMSKKRLTSHESQSKEYL